MKQTKLIAIIVATLSFTAPVAGGETGKTTVNIARKMVARLCKYVDLTDPQKAVVLNSATQYEAFMRSTLADSSIVNKQMLLDSALLKHRDLVDSLLTQEQKDTMEVRFNREMRANINQ